MSHTRNARRKLSNFTIRLKSDDIVFGEVRDGRLVNRKNELRRVRSLHATVKQLTQKAAESPSALSRESHEHPGDSIQDEGDVSEFWFPDQYDPFGGFS
jgi:hypothetical protein